MTAIDDLIASAAPPDDPEWPESGTLSVFADLIGSASGLIQAAPLVDKFLAAHRQDSRFGFWRQKTLHKDFQKAVESQGIKGVDWGYNENFCAWSSLFFLNKAEKNIAAALDICLNAWLRWRLDKMDPEDMVADDAWAFMMPRTKSMILQHGTSGRIAELLAELKEYSEAHTDTAEANRFVEGFHDECAGMTLEEVHALVCLTKRKSPIECAAVVVQRVNEFKHRVHGLMKRHGIDYATEWSITCLAHQGISQLWKEGMLEDTKELWKEKNPAKDSLAG